MQLNDFKLERYFAQYEFSVEYLLSPSDCESLTIPEMMEYADPIGREMWRNLKLGYTESKGHPVLREEIGRMYRNISMENVLVVTPEEGIFIALNTLLQPGDGVVAVSPVYQSLTEIPRALGCQVTSWPLEARNGEWVLDLERLERSIDSHAKILILNFPHNPTGYLPTRELFDGIVELARRYGLYIFADEMYWLSEHDPANRLPAIADVYEKGISLFGLSKTFGLPGLRIGWLATRDAAVMKCFGGFKDYTTICSSGPSEALAIIGLRAKEQLIERNMNIIQNNLRIAAEFFEMHADTFRWYSPKAGSTVFPELVTGVSVATFCEDVVMKKNLMILPGTVFDYLGNHFRVGLGRKDFPKALGRLEEYLQG